MSDFLKRISHLSPERLALLASELKSRLERVEGQLAQRDEPIAVVGMACRFPGGANDPEAYWALLRDGVDAVREVPAERWDVDLLYHPDPDRPGTMTSRWGSFLEGLEDFDPWFFGISPREAMGMDPQQRLLLEVAWEALENAGLSPDDMDGTPTGVFLGLCNQDYHALRLERPLEEIDTYFASGVAGSMAAGRIAYLLGLQGPALTVDTACSSSLVALHLACESLRSGESRTALAAGVSLILGPETMIGLSKARILSPEGRCRTFDESASGIVRGEGCAVVVLKRLSDAQADNDRILAMIRASGTNQDGRSSGITAPNGAAQEALLRLTLKRGGLAAADVDYVEAHGTGTSLGDPIEVRALAAAYGDRPAERPLRIGSVKTNLGHLEAAAGLAGFIKVVLALQHAAIPPHLHLRRRNPHVDWEHLPIDIPTTLTPWRRNGPGERRRGAVSSFGFSGTNAHVIVEEAPEPVSPPAAGPDRPAHLLALSARSADGLRQLAKRYADTLSAPDAPPLADACHTAATGRALQPYRLATVGLSTEEVARALRAWAEGEDTGSVRSGRAASAAACETVFLFTGQGSQAPGMGRELFTIEPVFRAALERCDELLRPHLSVPLLAVMHPESGDEALINRTEYAQPALFALEYALAELWRSWGVEPVAVMGHSLGEYVAATVAGLLPLEEALRLVARRGRLMQSLPAGGAMAAVFAPRDRVQAAAARHPSDLAIAALNGPENVVLSGSASSLDPVLEALATEGIGSRRLVVSHAFHSPLMEPILDEFESLLAEVAFAEPTIPIVSNLTGTFAAPGEMARPRYWREHLRRPVQFLEGIRTLEEAGHRTFLEIGPHPTLTGLAAACLRTEDALLTHSLRPGHGECAEMLDAAGALHVRGLRLDGEAMDRPWPRRTVTLPTSPFERRRFWSGWTRKGRTEASAESGAADGWFWETEWRDAPLPGAPADPVEIAARLTPRAADLVRRHGAEGYAHGLPLLDTVCRAFIVRALRALGAPLAAGDRLERASLRESLGVGHVHERLFHRMLDILVEDGVLAHDGEYLVVTGAVPDDDPEQLAAQLIEVAPAVRAEARLTVHCGRRLADVLRGETDPLELLFPGGSTDEAAALYADAPSFRVFNALVRDAVVEVGAARADDAPVRILEVGGGTGGVTQELLPALPRDRTRYVFTDISPLFTARAKERFAAHSGFETGVLDITRDPVEQGFEPGSFELVVASNVLHATPDLRQTLSNIRTLLAPGGVLVVLEGVLPQRFGDLTVGLTEGWWSFSDTELRPDYALLNPERWLHLLGATGFEAPAAFPDVPASAGDVLAQQRVLLARRPLAEAARAQRWLAVTGGGENSTAVVEALRSDGLEVTVAVADSADPALERALAAVAEERPLQGIVHLVALDVAGDEPDAGADAVDRLRAPCESALSLVHALAERGGPRLVLVTRGAEAVEDGEAVDPVGAPLWGLARGVALEHPELQCVCVDLPPTGAGADRLAAVLRADPREDQVAIRGGSIRVPRIRPAEVTRPTTPLAFRQDAAYLVTGGLAGLGLRVARWMAERGAGTLLLAGRREPSHDALAEIDQMERLGARVRVVRGDVADPEAVAAMLLAAGDCPLRGVMHAAGTTDDAALLALDWTRMRGVMQAKVAGSWNLHIATREMALDHFVLFSSGAAFLGSPGQANHAAANAFLGALAQRRAAQGLPALAVEWGPWSELGAATRGDVLERARAAGLHAIDPERGLEALEWLMSGRAPRVAVLPLNWTTYLDRIPAGAERPWFDVVRPIAPQHAAGPAATAQDPSEAGHAPTVEATPGVAHPAPAPDLATRVAAAVPARRRDVLLDGLRDIAGRVLGATGDEIDPATPLTELGLDSLMAVEMRNRVATALGRTLPATLLFNYPSLDELSGFLIRDFLEAEPDPQPIVEQALVAASALGGRDLDELSEDEVADLLTEKLKDV